jgi:hypothetical protein
MFDHLRQQSMRESEPEEEDRGPLLGQGQTEEPAPPSAARRSSGGRFLGLTPQQRFVLALMLFLNVTVLGCFALLAFERIALPF